MNVLSNTQQKIYDGLRTIGEEIASFYLDGVSLLNDEKYASRAYLLAHIAREIDGGLRDILAPNEVKKAFQEVYHTEEFKSIKGHVSSILVALDLDDDKPLAKEYIDVSSGFVKEAHRRGAYKEPRKPDTIIKLWERYETILYKLFGDYISQLNHIDRILKFATPNDYIIGVLKNFFSEEEKERHFYKNLKHSSWLKTLYEHDFFNPDKIPPSIENKYWYPLEYLINISEQIRLKECNEKLSVILIKIVYEICNSNSYKIYSNDIRLWYFLLKILSNLPKKFISLELVDLLPKFLSSENSNLIGKGLMELIESYLDEKELLEIEKSIVENLLIHSLTLSKEKRFKESSLDEDENIYSIVPLYVLKDNSTSKDFAGKVITYCSDKVIQHILSQLKIYLEAEIYGGIFRNSIFFDSDRSYNDYTIEVIYTDLLKTLLKEISHSDKLRYYNVTSLLTTDQYAHFYFEKLFYFSLAQDFGRCSTLFFKYVLKNNTIFSNSNNHHDLFFLLRTIAVNLSVEESSLIKTIVDKGSQNKLFYFSDKDMFKLYWYSALRENNNFTSMYDELSIKYNRTYKDFEPKLEKFVTVGCKSPFSVDDLLHFTPQQLSLVINNYDPPRGFDMPNAEGLANSLEEVTSYNPHFFYDNYKIFLRTPFIYTTRMIYGVTKALSDNKDIKWNKIINFILQYINQKAFEENELQLKNDSLSYDKLSFIYAACRLLSKANGNVQFSYGKSLIAKTEKIFELLLPLIKFDIDESRQNKLGSASYLLNSTNGLILESYLLFLLRKARDINPNAQVRQKRWGIQEEALFDKLYNSKCPEFFMLLGLFKSQLLFIDYDWTIDKVYSIPKKGKSQIKSFFGTHIFSSDPGKLDYIHLKEIYHLAIAEDWKTDEYGMSNTLERHISIFYLFGYDDFSEGSLLRSLLEKKNTKQIGNIIHFFGNYVKGYTDTLQETEQREIHSRILKLWKECYITLESLKTEDSNLQISGLVNFLQFVDEINENNFTLIKNTSIICSRHWEMDRLLKFLDLLKSKGDIYKTADYIIEILNQTIFSDRVYINDLENKMLIIIKYLYTIQDSQIREKINNLCNRLVRHGIYFVKDVYALNN